MTTVDFDTLRATLERALRNAGLPPADAELCARVHAESSRDGVNSHGIDRIPRFVDYVKRGWVDVAADLSLVQSAGSLEVYDGHFGIGVSNAMRATRRAMALAREHGMGVVALRDTTHWMRGGSYAWHAAENGFAAILWTNTESCMPAWGAATQCIGNNPLVMAVPRERGPLVLDMAMSQFSYGRLKSTRLRGERLPVDGGFDAAGALTRDPGAIEASRRILPTGYWKGSGLAILLDALGALLAQGRPSHAIDRLQRGSGTGCCQVFMLFDPERLGGREACEAIGDGIAAHLAGAEPASEGAEVRYPGESTLSRRRGAGREGIPVDAGIWEEVRRLAGESRADVEPSSHGR